MALTSGSHVRSLTSDTGLPVPHQIRLNELQALQSRHFEALFNTSPSDSPDNLPPSSTSPTMAARGDALSFRGASDATPRITRFIVEQEFEGMVVSIDTAGNAFIARLADLTGDGPEEEAEIAFDEISPDDRSLIVPGALFSWTIGRATETGGQVRRVSELRFRRFFRFTRDAIARAEKNARRMLELLNDGNSESK
jgi:hypothetical protein